MTKAEILEAINATIAPNGVKGITAESLANILTEIVNAAGEGGGGAGGEYIATEHVNPDSDSLELTEEAMAHNAELFAKLTDIMANGGCMPSVSLNMDGLVMYATSLMPTEDGTIAALFNGPVLGLDNYIVMGMTADGTSTSFPVGSNTVLVVFYINPDGSLVLSLPGLES